MRKNKTVYAIVILSAIGTLTCFTVGDTNTNPECKGIQDLATKLNGMNRISSRFPILSIFNDLNCTPLKNCSGVNCIARGYSFVLLVNHCTKPIRMLMHLKIPGKSVDEWKVFESGQTTQILKDFSLSSLKISMSLKPIIIKHGNTIEIKMSLCLVFGVITSQKCLQLPNATLTVSNSSCMNKKQDGSTVAPKASTTGIPIERSTKKVAKTTKMTPKKVVTRPNTKVEPTSKQSTTTNANVKSSTKKAAVMTSTTSVHQPTESKKGRQKKQKKNEQSHKTDLSTGAKVAIGTSAILIIFLVVALLLYWRKLKGRRPAYYNDILTNRDSLQGFDDEEPLFDSHLVL